MQSTRGLKAAWRVGAVLAAGAVFMAACGGSSTTSTTTTGAAAPTTTVAAHVTGGPAYFAEGAAAKPNWIFPFSPGAYFSVTNLTQFQELMYRPLFYFGPPTTTSPNVDLALSLGNQPVWSNGDKT